MNSIFDQYVTKLDDLLSGLTTSEKYPMTDSRCFPVVAGCYAISEGDNVLYVGISKNLRQRIKNHTAGRANQSAFAFRLAREKVGAPVTYRREGSRTHLMTQSSFVNAMKLTTERVRAMSAQFVQISDPSLLYLFEFYAAKLLKTRYNHFTAH